MIQTDSAMHSDGYDSDSDSDGLTGTPDFEDSDSQTPDSDQTPI